MCNACDACVRARDRACAIVVLSPRANHPPARARAARAHAALGVAASRARTLHYLRSRLTGEEKESVRTAGKRARGRREKRRRTGGAENASATARILTRVARGPNSVTMRAARGIPRNTLNTSSSQKTNGTTNLPTAESVHTQNMHTYSYTYVRHIERHVYEYSHRAGVPLLFLLNPLIL